LAVTDRVLISVLVAVAMLRTLLFAGAFPLFNNVDEAAHIDIVIKREMGMPIGLDVPYAMATRNMVVRYGTGFAIERGEIKFYWGPEYHSARLPTGEVTLPFWMAPATVQSAYEPGAQAILSHLPRNHQACEPQLYYALAAEWARLGRLLGFVEARLLYWVRAIDVVIVGMLVVLAAAFGRLVGPTSRTLRVGLPLLVAAIPQKTLYSITNDVLSPLIGGLALYYGVRALVSEPARVRDAPIAGIMIGLAILTKLTNVLLIVLAPLLVVSHLRRRGIAEASRSACWLIGAMALPLVIWEIAAGPSAIRPCDKAASLGWTYRPLVEFGEHPIFTMRGAWYFLFHLLASFWRGELIWHGAPLAQPAMDMIYVVSSLALLGVAGVRLFRESRPEARRGLMASFAIVSAGVLVLAGLSMVFNFGDFHYPSRALPFFASGRLIGAALLPFAALYVYGLEALLARTVLRGRELLVILTLAILVTVVELMLSIEVIMSPYNWFHLS
jgi:Dolichyl-phosphate-mannose-protein mannosyltransferase